MLSESAPSAICSLARSLFLLTHSSNTLARSPPLLFSPPPPTSFAAPFARSSVSSFPRCAAPSFRCVYTRFEKKERERKEEAKEGDRRKMLTALSSVKSSSSAGGRAADDDDDDYGGGQARFVSCVRPRLCLTPSLTLGPLQKLRQRLQKGLDRPVMSGLSSQSFCKYSTRDFCCPIMHGGAKRMV